MYKQTPIKVENKNDSTKTFLNNNEDKDNIFNSEIDIKNKIMYIISILLKLFLMIFIFYINIIYEVENYQIDLNNYVDKVYGENDLLKIIEEKEKEKLFSYGERKKELEKEIKDINNAIKKIKEKKKEFINNNKKIIRNDGKLTLACSFALNNNFVYPTIVSITSLVDNAGKNIFYDIYVLVSPDFTKENKNIIMTVENKYKEHCKIYIINMGNKFIGLDTNNRTPIASYYRLDLHNLLPNVDRIVYMDGDVGVFQDLSDLITLDMKGNYILGFLDSSLPNHIEKYNIKNAIILCAGVLLMDLSALRKNNITDKFNKFFEKYLGDIYQHDQTTINVVCQGKIGILPPKYGLWNYKFFRQLNVHSEYQIPYVTINKKELILAYKQPAILHYVKAKPYHKRTNNKYYFKEWWEYAKKTDYYDEICKYAY